MKKIITLLSVLCLGMINFVSAGEQLKEPRSPLMSTQKPDGEQKGVWIPDSYGGVTGVVLDLDQVGTNNMLRVRFNKASELTPFHGEYYRVHSDQTIENVEDESEERTVILINERLVELDGSREIICYKIRHEKAQNHPSGVTLRSEMTHYSLTFSRIRNEFEVLYLIPFRVHITGP